MKKAKRRALNFRNKLKTASAGLKAGGKPIPRVPKFKASRRKGTHNIGQHEKGGEKYKCDKGGAAKAALFGGRKLRGYGKSGEKGAARRRGEGVLLKA